MGLCLGPYGGPRGLSLSYERGTLVHRVGCGDWKLTNGANGPHRANTVGFEGNFPLLRKLTENPLFL